MSDSSILIFSGYNPRAITAFCRFAALHRVPISIVARGDSDPIYRTAYAKHVVAERSGDALEVGEIDRVVDAARSAAGVGRFELLPSSEYLIRFFLAWRDHFERRGVSLPLCDRALYERVSDKASFCELCSAAGLDVPAEVSPGGSLEYPLVIKPRRYFDAGGNVQTGPILVFDAEQHAAALERVAEQEVFLQEYVQGDSYYLLYFVSRDGEHVSFSQRNLIQQAEGRSIVAAVPATLHREPVGRAYLQLLVEAGFHGLVMVEIRRTEHRDVMIEANPRLWGPSQLFLDCDAPIFQAFAASLGYIEGVGRAVASAPAAARYFWAGGMLSDLAAGREPAYHGYTPAEFARELHLWMQSDVYLRPDTLEYGFETLRTAEQAAQQRVPAE